MTKPIDITELKARMFGLVCPDGYDSKSYFLGVDDVGDLIDSCVHCPSVENKGEWIPVSERLPEKNEWVLVSVEQPSGNCYQEIMRIDKYRGLWTDNFDYYADYVKAWMPLPEPYKAESEE